VTFLLSSRGVFVWTGMFNIDYTRIHFYQSGLGEANQLTPAGVTVGGG